MNAGVQTNTLAARQSVKMAQERENREKNMHALSEQNLPDNEKGSRHQAFDQFIKN
jgi:hypothetical protein